MLVITRGYPWFKKNPRSQILQIPAQIFSDAISEVLDLEPEVTWDDIGHGGAMVMGRIKP